MGSTETVQKIGLVAEIFLLKQNRWKVFYTSDRN